MSQTRLRRIAILALLAALGSGCSSARQFYANIYEGLRFRQQQETPASERSTMYTPMSYPQYEAERDHLLRKEKKL